MSPRHSRSRDASPERARQLLRENAETYTRVVQAIESGRAAGRIADENAALLLSIAERQHEATTRMLTDLLSVDRD